ncbi:MAG TPA: glucose-6-phosphate dehydrogenase [Verrucomicrobiae bacterium]|nr:glucose-6-phosphate dehydrogenase [Verrucomicrobiae bacterium]
MNYDHLKRPLLLVIFGITGDLAQRKLLPALYQLLKAGDLPEELRIVGISRRDVTKDDVYTKLRSFVGESGYSSEFEKILKEHTEMVQMDLLNPDAYRELLEHLQSLESHYEHEVSRLYYLSIPSQAFTPVIRLLGQTGHSRPLACGEDPRLLIEKPFGYDLLSARELVRDLGAYFDEDQIYRIDHYVAKETVQNILIFRFQNPLFESIWNSKHIDHISVVAREQIDIEGRVDFYEQTGALRDFVQNHLLQLLAITTMARPRQLESDAIHASKLELLKAIQPIRPAEVDTRAIRAQYEGYRTEVKNPSSSVETYAHLTLAIDNDQWRGVPIVLETGKALDAKSTEISICFRQPDDIPTEQNRLVFRIQPTEGITLRLQTKRPGIKSITGNADMDFDYAKSFNQRPAEAYERVIVDAIRGDQTLFASAPEVIRSWEIIEYVLQRWMRNGEGLLSYAKGSTGPVDNSE